MNSFNFPSAKRMALFLIGAFSILLLLLWPFGEFPLADDWVHSWDVFYTLKNGKITLTKVEAVWFLPQFAYGLFVSKIFGFSHVLLRTAGVLAAIGSGYFLWKILQKTDHRFHSVLLGVCAFLFFTPTFVLIPTFLTDMPFMFFWLLACYYCEKAFTEKNYQSAAFSFFCIFLSLLQRQNGLVLAIALAGLSAFFFLRSSENRKFYFFLLSMGLMQFVLFFISSRWWDSISEHLVRQTLLSAPLNATRILEELYIWLMYLGLAVFPLVFLGDFSYLKKLFLKNRVFTILLLFVFLCLLFKGFSGQRMPYFSNQLSKLGLFDGGEVLLGDRPKIISNRFDWVLTFISFTGLVVFLSAVFAFIEDKVKPLAVSVVYPFGFFSVVASFGVFLSILIRGVTFDRYLVPVLPGAIILVLSITKKDLKPLQLELSLLATLCVVLFSWTICFDYFRWNEARWKAIESASEKGIKAEKIHGGYEWHGWNFPTVSYPRWLNTNPNFIYSDVVSFSAIDGFDAVETFSYLSIWAPHKRQIYLLEKKKGELVKTR